MTRRIAAAIGAAFALALTAMTVLASVVLAAEGDPVAGPTFASFLTPAGAIVAAGVATGFIELIKSAIPAIGNVVSGALMAFALTAILYVLTGLSVGIATPDAALNVFLAWLTCATSAIGIRSAANHVGEVKAGTAGPPDPPEGAGG